MIPSVQARMVIEKALSTESSICENSQMKKANLEVGRDWKEDRSQSKEVVNLSK